MLFQKLIFKYTPSIKFIGKRSLIKHQEKSCSQKTVINNVDNNLNLNMSNGSAKYSIGLRIKFEQSEINCINMGGFNEKTIDYKTIALKK